MSNCQLVQDIFNMRSQPCECYRIYEEISLKFCCVANSFGIFSNFNISVEQPDNVNSIHFLCKNGAHGRHKSFNECSCKRITVLWYELKIVASFCSPSASHFTQPKRKKETNFKKTFVFLGRDENWPSANITTDMSFVLFLFIFVFFILVHFDYFHFAFVCWFGLFAYLILKLMIIKYFVLQTIFIVNGRTLVVFVTVSIFYSAEGVSFLSDNLLHVDCEVFVIWSLRYTCILGELDIFSMTENSFHLKHVILSKTIFSVFIKKY